MIALSLLRSHHYKGQLNTTVSFPFEHYKNPTETGQRGVGLTYSLSKGSGSIWTLGHFIFLTPKRMQTCGNITCFKHTSVCTELILAENVVPV